VLDYIREGGWGMYPIMILGATAVVLAIRYAFEPNKTEVRTLTIYFLVATLIAGCLGTAVGVQKSAAAIGGVENARKWIFLLGLKESLNCFVSAFVVGTIATLIMAFGGFRRERQLRVIRDNATLPHATRADA